MELKEEGLPKECGPELIKNCADAYVEVAEIMSRIHARMQQDDEYARNLRKRHMAFLGKEENEEIN